jgi:hypothetical protein
VLDLGAPLTGSRWEELMALWDGGLTDLASLTVRLRARPASIVRTLQAAGRLSEHVSAEQLVYARYFRGVLRLETTELVEDSVTRLERLWQYFGRLDDQTGLHQVMVLALTGFNRLRWGGRGKQAERFWRFLEGRAGR